MNDTSFLWEARFDGRLAVELESGIGRFIEGTRWKANAAASIVTNASDYARFLASVTEGTGLKPETRAAMLAPQVALTSKSLFSAPGTDGGRNRAHEMAWTLGWGTFTGAHGRALFHVGREEGCENYAELFLGRGLGVVVLSASRGPDSFSAPLAGYALGEAFSPLHWLEYGTPVFMNPMDAGRSYAPVALTVAAVAIGAAALIFRRLRSARRRAVM